MKTKSEAAKLGRKMKAMMNKPELWEIYIHENIGWFVRLKHIPSKGSIHVSPGYNGELQFSAMMSLTGFPFGDTRWTDSEHFNHPQKAVDHTMNKARIILKREQAAFTKIEKGMK